MASARSTVLLLLLAYFAVRLPWLFLVPMIEAPDEYAHFWMLRFLTEHMRLPEAREVFAGGPSAVYGSYPPWGYLPHVLTSVIAAKITPHVDISLASRFGSLLIGAVMVPCAFYIGRIIFAGSRLFQLALPLLLVFHPQLVFVQSYANCDSTTASLGSITLVLLVKMLKDGLSMKLSVLLGITLAWLTLTKYSGYAILPTAAIAMCMAAFLHRVKFIKLVMHGLTALGITAAMSLWWFIRNAAIFDGDYLGTKTMYRTWATTFHRELDFHKSAWSFLRNHRWWRTIIYSYWGFFGYMKIEMNRVVYIVYQTFMGISIVAALTKLASARKAIADRWKESLKADGDRTKLIVPASWLLLGLSLFINLAAMVYASMANYGLAQGRYLFPNEIPVLALLLGGLFFFRERLRNGLALGLVLFNAVACLLIFITLLKLPQYSFNFVRTYVQ